MALPPTRLVPTVAGERKMRFLRLDTIGKKLLIPITALTMILLIALGTSMILNTQSSVQSMMDSKGNSLANLLEKISASYIINYDFPALEGFVQEAIKDPDEIGRAHV